MLQCQTVRRVHTGLGVHGSVPRPPASNLNRCHALPLYYVLWKFNELKFFTNGKSLGKNKLKIQPIISGKL